MDYIKAFCQSLIVEALFAIFKTVFKKWLLRPALNLSVLADELTVDRVNLYKIISGLRNPPRAKRGRFYAIAQKYGYSAPHQI
ncbi:MAG: hypothetical protein KA165_00775 [Saprospiraceae bacterium]|nr:hypothetical protein [Saprospiraceae bacterium]